MTGTTGRQEEVLKWIRDRYRAKGVPPTIREIGAAPGIAGPNAVRGHLLSLARKGLVRKPEGGRARGWMPAVEPGCCPCCGRPAAEGEAGA